MSFTRRAKKKVGKQQRGNQHWPPQSIENYTINLEGICSNLVLSNNVDAKCKQIEDAFNCALSKSHEETKGT
eukprot:7802692-Karenia_brevis.AAC.1